MNYELLPHCHLLEVAVAELHYVGAAADGDGAGGRAVVGTVGDQTALHVIDPDRLRNLDTHHDGSGTGIDS